MYKTIRFIFILLLIGAFSSPIFAARKKRVLNDSTGPAKMEDMEGPTVKTDRKSMKERDKAIKQLKDLIKSYPEGPQKAEVYRRLAEMYWEKSRGIKAVIMEKYNKLTDKYYELNDPSAPMPELDLKPAWKWNYKAIEVCEYIQKKYDNFGGMAEVYFFMASNLMEVGQPLKAIRYYKLVVERFGKSKYAADAYYQMGEYFFANNNVFKAMPSYKAIIDNFKGNKFYGFALYKYAWCLYNVGEYEKSVKAFQNVVTYSDKFKKVSLKEEALKDMVNPFAEAGSVSDAERYFKNIVKEKAYFLMVLKKLAAIYFEQDRNKEAVTIYKKLQKEAPLRPEGPQWQKQIVESYKKMNSKDNVRKEIIALVKNYADPKSKWFKANKKDDTTVESARQTAEAALRNLTVEYHNESRKTKSKKTVQIVSELYPIYLEYFSKSEAAYDIRFNYAEHLYEHKKFPKAGDQYQMVAEMNPKGHHFEDASYGAVSCFQALLEKDQKRAQRQAKERLQKSKREGAGQIKQENVQLADSKVQKKQKIADEFKKKPIPELHRKFIKACDTYIENIPRSKYLVNIIYQQAITYYAFNHFDKAVPVFELIVKKYPRDKLAVFAADLIMASLDITKDWEAINDKAREFLRNSALLSGRNRLKKDLLKFKEMASFYACDIPYRKHDKGLESAERYRAFVTEFPKSKFNDIALYNAIVYFQKGGDLYKSIQVQERFLRERAKVYRESKVRKKVMFGLAKNYEAIAYYDKAADLYIDFVSKTKEDKNIKDAIFNAAVLYENLGDTEKAIDNYKLYIDKYAKNDEEKQKWALQFGYIWMRKGRTFYDKARKGFNKFFTDYAKIRGLKKYYYIDEKGKKKDISGNHEVLVKDGDPNTIFAVYKAFIEMAEEEGNKEEFYKYIDAVLQLFRNGKFENKKTFAETSRDIIARAMIEELQHEYDEYMMLKLNVSFKKKLKGYDVLQWGYDVKDGKIVHLGGGNPDDLTRTEKANLKIAAKEKDKFNKESTRRITKKVELMDTLQKKYTNIIGLTKSPRHTPGVLYYIGMIYWELTDQMFKAPIAPWLSENQIIAYKQFLDEKAINARQKSVVAFETAMNKGYETSVYNKWVKKAKYQLRFFQELRPGKYYDENEIVPNANMIETSSLIGRIDFEIKFPELEESEREKLENKLNKSKKVPAPVKQKNTKNVSINTTGKK